MTRTFTDTDATRTQVPLLVGLMGPSGGGKTFSALRLATGIQRVSGGDIYVIDTEARRSLHYADQFQFRHLEFKPPFGSLDYLAAIEHCVGKGAGVVVIDSMSHEHEGPGGLLEQHAAETKRLAELWKTSEKKAQMAAWGPPKQARRRLINSILQLQCNFVFCFRAKEKIKVRKGQDPEPMGWMAIAGEEFVYEQTVCCLLMPGASGVPTWNPREPGEQAMVKLPAQFSWLAKARRPLCEDDGEAMAQWAAGGSKGAAKASSSKKKDATPRFAKNVAWDGADDWGGKPLADAPGDVLVAYGVAVEEAMQAEEDDGRRARWAGHLESVSKATKAAAAAE